MFNWLTKRPAPQERHYTLAAAGRLRMLKDTFDTYQDADAAEDFACDAADIIARSASVNMLRFVARNLDRIADKKERENDPR